MIIALLLTQAVPDSPVVKSEVVTEVAERSLAVPAPIEEAMQPYLHCMLSGSSGVTFTSAAQALATRAQSKVQCAEVRSSAKAAAITSLKKKSRLSQDDSALFVEAVLARVDDFTDETRVWCGR